MSRRDRRTDKAAGRRKATVRRGRNGADSDPLLILREAAAGYAERDLERADRLCQGLLDADPEFSEALELMGLIRAAQARHDEAIDLFRRLVLKTPADPRAHYNLGVAFLGAGRADDASEAFEAALSIDANQSAVWNALGSASWAAGRRSAALAAYREAVARGPEDPAALNNLGGTLAELGRAEEAEPVLDRAAAAAPGNLGALLNLAQARRTLGKLDPALEAIEAALALLPDDPDSLVTKGHLLLDRKDWSGARAAFEAAAKAAPARADARLGQGTAEEHLGNRAVALAHYRAAVDLEPESPLALFRLGQTLFEAGDAEAVVHLRAALEQDPRDSFGAALLLARLDAGETPEAWPLAYVARTFDGFAPLFDDHLVDKLGYAVPTDLRALFDATYPGREGLAVCDLGCGTGLCGAAFRDLADRLVGVDLSARMLERAKAREVFDAVMQEEAAASLRACPGAYDLILGGDLLIYIGDVAPLFAAAARALKPGGAFLFSIEEHDGDGVALRDSLRYAHGEEHVRECAAVAGLMVDAVKTCDLRLEKGSMMPGLLFALSLPS